ncbi:MAG: hypothetical protein H7Y18_01545 [Clostridiaceae bacterium]|nr:hypothetical protein [Clostridiaceae bacterium]
MLECEQCNYLINISSQGKKGKYTCELTEFIFDSKDQICSMSNHPCDNYRYDEGQLLNC